MARCPICRAEVAEAAATLPFCSPRCRLLDLGNWLDERYVVPAGDDESAGGGGDDEDREIARLAGSRPRLPS